MTDRLDLEARLAVWLTDEGSLPPPERLAHATRERIAATDQIGPVRTLRLLFPTRISRAAVLVAAAVALAIFVVLAGGSFFGLGSGPGGGPAGSPTPRPSLTSLSAAACPTGGGTCLGPLPAGVFQTTSFAPTVAYATPAGWANTLDSRGQVDLRYAAGGTYTYPDGTTFHDGISLFRRPVAESPASQTRQVGVGTTAGELARWLAARTDLVASEPAPVTIGGIGGWRVTISLPYGPRTSPDHCTTDHGEPRCASLFIGDDPAGRFGFGIVGPESAVVYLLDAPSGDTVMVVVDDVDGVDSDVLAARSQPVVDSLVFPS